MLRDLPGRLGFLFRYALIGGLGGVIQTATLYLWVSVLGHADEYLLGVALGFLIALGATFFLQKFWTFRDRSASRTRSQFLSFAAFALLSFLGNVLLLALAKLVLESLRLDFFHIWYLLSQAAIIVLLAGLNFTVNTLVIFKAPHRPTLP